MHSVVFHFIIANTTFSKKETSNSIQHGLVSLLLKFICLLCNTQAKEGCQIQARFADEPFSVYGESCPSHPTCYHWVELKYEADLSLRGPRYKAPTACVYYGLYSLNYVTGLFSFCHKMSLII